MLGLIQVTSNLDRGFCFFQYKLAFNAVSRTWRGLSDFHRVAQPPHSGRCSFSNFSRDFFLSLPLSFLFPPVSFVYYPFKEMKTIRTVYSSIPITSHWLFFYACFLYPACFRMIKGVEFKQQTANNGQMKKRKSNDNNWAFSFLFLIVRHVVP